MPVLPAQTPSDQLLAGTEGLGSPMSFAGFDPPESNFWRLPNNWFDLVAHFTSWAEHKVVEYILRHTWGYQEYGVVKLITMDEFMHGRKRRDGSRIDAGCGMAENSIKKGIADAVAHGFLLVHIDDSDKGRIKKYYGPKMRRPLQDDGAHSAQLPGGQTLLVQDQSLTLRDQHQIPDQQPLILSPQSQTLSPTATDPRTEKTSPRKQQQQDTPRNNNRFVLTAPSSQTAAPSLAAVTEHTNLDSPADNADLVARLVAEGIAPAKAQALVQRVAAERIERQLLWIDSRTYQNRSATLVTAIERDFGPPAPRRSSSPDPTPIDRSKYYRGAYALCPRCGCRPCMPDCVEPSVSAIALG